jgi:hypothetical protein
MFSSMVNDRRRIIKSIIQLVYFMRGAVQYETMMSMSSFERSMVSEFVEDRLEVESKKMYPQY